MAKKANAENFTRENNRKVKLGCDYDAKTAIRTQ